MPELTYRKSEEIWAEKGASDFEQLLDPYREGGTPDQPVRRTMGTLVDYLVNKKRYPVEVAGAAILIVFTKLFKGRTFDGDGSWGSKGREFVTVIRVVCDKLLQNKMQEQVFASIAGGRMAMINEFISREVELKTYPRWKKIFKRKQWHAKQAEYQALIGSVKNEST